MLWSQAQLDLRAVDIQLLILNPNSLGFSRAREPSPYPGVAEPYPNPHHHKSLKKSRTKKTSFRFIVLCEKMQFFVAGALVEPILHEREQENANFEARSRSRTFFFSGEDGKKTNFDICSRYRALFSSG